MGLLASIEKRFPEGSNLTILNTYYKKPEYDFSGRCTKMVEPDHVLVVYKDNNTGKKYTEDIKNPSYIYYKLNDDQPVPSYNKLFIEKEKVHPVEIDYKYLLKNIAENTGNEEFYKFNICNGKSKDNKKLFTDPSIFFADAAIDDHYRFRFNQTFKNDVCELDKGYFDIEVDGKFCDEDFPPLGSCPCNCVSYLDEKTNTVYTFILRETTNPLVKQFEDEILSGKFTENDIHNFVINAVNGYEEACKFGINETRFELRFYDYEIDLLTDLFNTIHHCSPDFCLGWNCSGFDIPYIIERIKVLGYDPEEIMCDRNINAPKIVFNFIDEKHLSEFEKRGDYTFITGNTVFIDQELQYASRRKAKVGSYNSFKLDDIGYIEADVHKLDYSHITHSVIDLPWLDFKTFVIYNIMDVIVQKCIESQTQDMEYIFAKCLMNNTCYQKGHRNTVYLTNRMSKDWFEKGYIIGNNINKSNVKESKFLGALVHDPTHNNSYSKKKIDHRPIWVVDNLLDFDFSSLYPSIMAEFNTAPNTQIGKIIIHNKIYKNEDAYNLGNLYSRSGEYIENMVCDNQLEFMERWFNLSSYENVLNDIDEFFKSKFKFTYKETNGNIFCPFRFYPSYKINPFIENKNSIRRSPFIIDSSRPKDYNYERIIIERGHKDVYD